jgi:hypothetical protein
LAAGFSAALGEVGDERRPDHGVRCRSRVEARQGRTPAWSKDGGVEASGPAGSTASSWQRTAKSRRELQGAMDERGRVTSTKPEQGEARPREEEDGRT